MSCHCITTYSYLTTTINGENVRPKKSGEPHARYEHRRTSTSQSEKVMEDEYGGTVCISQYRKKAPVLWVSGCLSPVMSSTACIRLDRCEGAEKIVSGFIVPNNRMAGTAVLCSRVHGSLRGRVVDYIEQLNAPFDDERQGGSDL